MTLFIGPVGIEGGPAIKNRLLLKYIDRKSEFKVCNTHNRSTINLIKIILTLILSKEKQIIIAVSRNGRAVLYPIIWIKKVLCPQLKYSTICIGGTIVDDAKKHPFMIKKALSKADVATVETKRLKKDYEEKLGLKNVHYMPNYKEIVHSRINSNSKKKFKSPRFVFLSSIRNVKGVGTMISVFNEILEEFPDAMLDIYGPIREDFDRKIFDDIEDNAQINYKGIVLNEKVIDTLSEYDIFLFPTEYVGEGFPAVLIEAYASGLVVVASDMNYNTEIVKDGVNGWVFPTGNRVMFKKVLLNCFNNSQKLNLISEQNKKIAKEFDAEVVIRTYREALSIEGLEI